MSEKATSYDWHTAEDPDDWRTINYDPEWHDFTARIAFDRPEQMNSYVLGTLKELCAAIEQAMGDPSAQFIVLTGEGESAFCTGGNVDEYAEYYNSHPQQFMEWGEYYGRVFDLILHCGIPVISRVNGTVAGGGWEFVSATDLAIATEDASFISPGPRVGMTSVGGLSQWLPLHMSHKKSNEMVLLSSKIDANEALDLGVVNEVVPSSDLDEVVIEYLDQMKTLSPTSLQYYKTHHNWWKDFIWRTTWEHAKSWFSLNMGNAEPSEGLWAFKNNESPNMEQIRRDIADGQDPSAPHGGLADVCEECGADYLPNESNYCLECGAKLR